MYKNLMQTLGSYRWGSLPKLVSINLEEQRIFVMVIGGQGLTRLKTVDQGGIEIGLGSC